MIHSGLPDHLGFGIIGDRSIFLDLKRDRYFELGSSDPAEMTEVLERSSLLVTGGRDVRPTASAVPTASLLDQHLARPSARTVIGAAWSLAFVTARLWIVGLEKSVGAGRRRNPASPACHGLAARFLASRRLLPIPPNCLRDSLALRHFLSRNSTPPALVFGVKASPFSAHCWLQEGGVIFNEAVDAAMQFTPVLVVR